MGDRAAEAETLNALGVACSEVGRNDEAVPHLERAVATWNELGDHEGELTGLHNLCAVQAERERHEEAVRCYERMVAIQREEGVGQDGLPSTLEGLAEAKRRLAERGKPRR